MGSQSSDTCPHGAGGEFGRSKGSDVSWCSVKFVHSSNPPRDHVVIESSKCFVMFVFIELKD